MTSFHEKLGRALEKLEGLEVKVEKIEKSVAKWAIVGGFLSGLLVSGAHVLAGCAEAPNVPPAVVVSLEAITCGLSGYAGAVTTCHRDTSCVAGELPGVARKCGIEIANLISIVQSHRMAEETETRGEVTDAGAE